MITQAQLIEKILAHLNGQVSEADLIRWAEDSFVTLTEADEDFPNEDTLLDILGYIGAGDTAAFPLTWTILSEFLERLGTRVRVVLE